MQIYDYQRECLDAIESARKTGSKKALVVMATGLGKTVVSALQLKRMISESPGRILYVTHQNEILRQARHTFEAIFIPETTFGYFHGEEKHLHKVDVLFASFQTMALSRELFARDEFKYIVVDEAHHVQADTYRPTIEYFQPDFMIGLTATPDRADQKDIRQLMGEPVFHLDLFEALADRHLTPISYLLMTDELQNLEVLETPAGKLKIAELNRTIFVPKRDEEIVRVIDEHTVGVKHPRIMIFCASIAHAERLEAIMPHAILVHSKMNRKIRQERIDEFRRSRAATVITVDIFNEGIDIPETNVIVFLRSTASRTIYLQQLGRGLRRVEGKEEVLVLDFVANCERIEMIGYVQKGVQFAVENRALSREGLVTPLLRPSFTLTIGGGRFDERLINLIHIVNLARKRNYTKDQLIVQLQDFYDANGRVPTRADLLANPEMATQGTFINVFGKKWNDILRELNLTVGKEYGLKKDVMTKALIDFAEQLGRTPSVSDVTANPNLPDPTTYRKVFGLPWNEVIASVGLQPNLKRYSRQELKERLVKLSETLGGRAPTSVEAAACEYLPWPQVIRKTFNAPSWKDVLRQVGL